MVKKIFPTHINSVNGDGSVYGNLMSAIESVGK
jgi:hypothetical protein